MGRRGWRSFVAGGCDKGEGEVVMLWRAGGEN